MQHSKEFIVTKQIKNRHDNNTTVSSLANSGALFPEIRQRVNAGAPFTAEAR